MGRDGGGDYAEDSLPDGIFLTLINFQTHNCLLLNFLLIGIVSRCSEIGLFKAVKIADQVGSKYLG